MAADGAARVYRATDNLVHPSWTSLRPRDVIEAVARTGYHWDRDTRTGVVLHMLSGLAVDGRIGLTAVAESQEDADRMYDACQAAITASAAAS